MAVPADGVGAAPADCPVEEPAGPSRAARAAPILLVALPFALLVLRECLRRPDYAYAGDEALIELDVRRVLHGDQLLGSYSRFGWRHPGPAWYSLLAGPYRLLGGHSWSLAAAVVLLSGLAAVGIVVVARRLGEAAARSGSGGGGGGRGVIGGAGAVPAVLAGLLVLLLVRELGFGLFRLPWNPVAVVLPSALFLLLAAAWLRGHPTTAGWTLVLGSVLVQTHVGTGVLVAAVVAAVGAVRAALALRRVRSRRTAPASAVSPARRSPWRPVGFAVLLGLVWLGPVVQQLSSAPGNLDLLRTFAAQHPERLPWRVAAGYLSTPLAVIGGRRLPLGAELPQSGAALAGVAGVAAAVLLTVAALLRSRSAAAVALVFLVALLAAVQTIRQNVGPEFGYLVLWMTVLPVVLGLGYLLLLADLLRRRRTAQPTRAHPTHPRGYNRPVVRLAVPVVVAVAGLAVVATAPRRTVFEAKPAGPQHRLDELAVAAVGRVRGPVLIRDEGNRRWPQAAGIVLALRRVGLDAKVPPEAGVLFSRPYVTDHPAAVTLQVLPVPGAAPSGVGDAGCVLHGMPGTCLRLVR